jgi:hypothetical protein
MIQPQLFATMQLQQLAHCGCVDVTPVPQAETGLTIVPNPASDKIENQFRCSERDTFHSPV